MKKIAFFSILIGLIAGFAAGVTVQIKQCDKIGCGAVCTGFTIPANTLPGVPGGTPGTLAIVAKQGSMETTFDLCKPCLRAILNQ